MAGQLAALTVSPAEDLHWPGPHYSGSANRKLAQKFGIGPQKFGIGGAEVWNRGAEVWNRVAQKFGIGAQKFGIGCLIFENFH